MNGQVRYCIDFHNLDKACLKDKFSLPNINMMVDATTGHSIFSFMDGFCGYNHFKIDPFEVEKTSFWTPMDNFNYNVMLFKIKNAGGIY